MMRGFRVCPNHPHLPDHSDTCSPAWPTCMTIRLPPHDVNHKYMGHLVLMNGAWLGCRTYFANCELCAANFVTANFGNCELWKLFCELWSANFGNCELWQLRTLAAANFYICELWSVNVGNCKVWSTHCGNCKLWYANFGNCKLWQLWTLVFELCTTKFDNCERLYYCLFACGN